MRGRPSREQRHLRRGVRARPRPAAGFRPRCARAHDQRGGRARRDDARRRARRLLHTLLALGYARQDGGSFRLTPKVLVLGQAYLSSLSLREAAQPVLDRLADSLDEVAALSILEGGEIVFVARAERRSPLARGIGLGGRIGVRHVDGTRAARRSGSGAGARAPRGEAARGLDAVHPALGAGPDEGTRGNPRARLRRGERGTGTGRMRHRRPRSRRAGAGRRRGEREHEPRPALPDGDRESVPAGVAKRGGRNLRWASRRTLAIATTPDAGQGACACRE